MHSNIFLTSPFRRNVKVKWKFSWQRIQKVFVYLKNILFISDTFIPHLQKVFRKVARIDLSNDCNSILPGKSKPDILLVQGDSMESRASTQQCRGRQPRTAIAFPGNYLSKRFNAIRFDFVRLRYGSFNYCDCHFFVQAYAADWSMRLLITLSL